MIVISTKTAVNHWHEQSDRFIQTAAMLASLTKENGIGTGNYNLVGERFEENLMERCLANTDFIKKFPHYNTPQHFTSYGPFQMLGYNFCEGGYNLDLVVQAHMTVKRTQTLPVGVNEIQGKYLLLCMDAYDQHMRKLVNKYGSLQRAFYKYNGSGEKAELYSTEAMQLYQSFLEQFPA